MSKRVSNRKGQPSKNKAHAKYTRQRKQLEILKAKGELPDDRMPELNIMLRRAIAAVRRRLPKKRLRRHQAR